MKKVVLGLAVSVVTFGVCVSKDVGKIVSIDSIEILQKSKEGKKLTDEIKKKINDYQEEMQKAQKEVAELEKEIKDKKDVLSKDAMEDKQRCVDDKKKELGGRLAQQEEALRLEIQSRQVQLRNKQLAVTNKMCEENAWGMAIDKNTPGVLFTAKSIDKTNEVLKKIDAVYDSSLKKSSSTLVASSSNKSKVADAVKARKKSA